MGNVCPLEAERLPAAGVKLAVQQGQTLPPVKGLALYRWLCTPSRLKLPITSASTRSRRGRAAATFSAGMQKVTYLARSIPLLLLAIWFFSIPVYSVRTLLKRSSASEIFTL